MIALLKFQGGRAAPFNSQAASRSLVLAPRFAQQLADARGALRPRVELEVEFRRVSKPERAPDFPPDKPAGAPEARDCRGGPRLALDMREKHAAVPQIVGHRNGGQCHAAQPRILEVPD